MSEVSDLLEALARERSSTAFWQQQFNHERAEVTRLAKQVRELSEPVQLLLACPECGVQHVDEDEWAARYHHTHRCVACGNEWSPALRATVGVRVLATREVVAV